jgi:hypothetical protein
MRSIDAPPARRDEAAVRAGTAVAYTHLTVTTVVEPQLAQATLRAEHRALTARYDTFLRAQQSDDDGADLRAESTRHIRARRLELRSARAGRKRPPDVARSFHHELDSVLGTPSSRRWPFGSPIAERRIMTTNQQVAVWIDHNEAKIFHVTQESFARETLHAPAHHLHRRALNGPKSADASEAKHFFDDVARALADAEQVLVVGPATAKLELLRHLHAHDRALERKVIGVETVDHPSDGQMAAYTRRYFADAVHGSAH